jgi:endogenous inhibitor of DNA gyrase (YacG/DUF329 family)
MTSVPCPICKKPVELGAPQFPFCSDRCRLIDLGRWADEEYRVPSSSPVNPESDQDDEE